MPIVSVDGKVEWRDEMPRMRKPCCGQSAPQQREGPCDVCVLVDHNESVKPTNYCRFCDAWLCMACAGDWVKRAQAWAIRKHA